MRELIEQARTAVEACATASWWPLPDPDAGQRLIEMFALLQAGWAAVLHGVREIDGRGFAAAAGAPSTKAWLRAHLQISAGDAARLVTQATAVDEDPRLDAALIKGRLNIGQLAAIVESMQQLPPGLSPATRQQAAETLLGFTPQLDPVQLRRAGRRILAHVAPEVEDAADRAALERSERAAHLQRSLKFTTSGDGWTLVRGRLAAEDAAIVNAALDPLCVPDAATAEAAATAEPRTPDQRRADALVDLCRGMMAGAGLPESGGDRPQVAITIGYDDLVRKLGAGLLDSGDPISAEAARRLACDAHLMPFVLGGAGQVLDAGRSRRLVTGPLRRALVVRDRGCAFPGCDRPARWSEGHHIRHWLHGGPTDLDNLVLLCAFHHRLVHDEASGWQVRMNADRHPEFLPPAWLDPDRTPRRNPYHART